MIGNVNPPQNKRDLIKGLNSLNSIKVKVIEPVTRQSTGSLKREIDGFIGNDEVSIIVIKGR